MPWTPTEEENKYLQTVASMTIDCIMGNGTENKETYVSNLRLFADAIEKTKQETA